MKAGTQLFLVVLFLSVFTGIVYSQQMEDVIYLRNGTIIHGIIIEQVPNVSIKIKTKDGNVFAFKMEEVDKMTKEETSHDYLTNTTKFGTDGFRSGKFLIGLKAGYGDWGSVTYGASFEYAISEYLGISLDGAYTTWDGDSYTYPVGTFDTTNQSYTQSYNYSLMGGLLGISYHFTPGKKIDFYVKAGGGYFFIDATEKWSPRRPSSYSSYSSIRPESSGVGYGGQVGLNYFFSKNFGATISAGWPFYASGGITIKL